MKTFNYLADRQSFHRWIRLQTRLLAKIYGNKNQGIWGSKETIDAIWGYCVGKTPLP